MLISEKISTPNINVLAATEWLNKYFVHCILQDNTLLNYNYNYQFYHKVHKHSAIRYTCYSGRLFSLYWFENFLIAKFYLSKEEIKKVFNMTFKKMYNLTVERLTIEYFDCYKTLKYSGNRIKFFI